MERAARFLWRAGRHFPAFFCWARDCPFEFGPLLPGDTETEPHSIALACFVWSGKERLYLMPKKHTQPKKSGVLKFHAATRELIEKYEKNAAWQLQTKGESFSNRYLKQMVKEEFAAITHVYIPADGRAERARCPLCGKVSILSHAANGAPVGADESQREIKQQNNGHLKQSQKLLEPP